MARSEAQKRAVKKWNDENLEKMYDRITILVPKGRKTTIEAFVKANRPQYRGVSGYAAALIQADMGISDDDWRNP